MTRADMFIDMYKNLEELLWSRYPDGKQYSGSAVMRYYNSDEGAKWREELNVCREMRNILSHHASIDGEAVFEPSDGVIAVLGKILEDVKNPPMAKTVATPSSRLVTCGLSDLLDKTVAVMRERGYSHVPVVERDRLYGVFSVGTVFSMLEKYGAKRIEENSHICDFSEFLPIDRHMTEAFGFVSEKAPYSSLKESFNACGPKHRRIAALFVTPNGKKDEPLSGIITPWDMIKKGR